IEPGEPRSRSAIEIRKGPTQKHFPGAQRDDGMHFVGPKIAHPSPGMEAQIQKPVRLKAGHPVAIDAVYICELSTDQDPAIGLDRQRQYVHPGSKLRVKTGIQLPIAQQACEPCSRFVVHPLKRTANDDPPVTVLYY